MAACLERLLRSSVFSVHGDSLAAVQNLTFK